MHLSVFWQISGDRRQNRNNCVRMNTKDVCSTGANWQTIGWKHAGKSPERLSTEKEHPKHFNLCCTQALPCSQAVITTKQRPRSVNYHIQQGVVLVLNLLAFLVQCIFPEACRPHCHKKVCQPTPNSYPRFLKTWNIFRNIFFNTSQSFEMFFC